jgi:glycosyltransferase involved in cell wall biosynthesis
MKFFILTPSFNSQNYLKRCIKSVRDQSTDGLEVFHIVQDGQSTDGSVEYLKNYVQNNADKFNSNYSFSFKSTADDSMYDALNKGVELALNLIREMDERISIGEKLNQKHEYRDNNILFAWLNCDEQYLPGTLKKIAEAFERRPHIDFFYGNTLHVNNAGNFLTYRKNPPLRKLYVRTDHLYIQSASTFFRASIFEEGARFDTSLKAISDCLFIMDLLTKGKTSGRLNDYFSVYTLTGNNLSIEDVGLKELKCWHDTAPAFIRLFRPIINGFRYLEKWLAGGYSEKFPLMYSIYLNNNEKRERIVTNSGSWKFTWGR